MTNREVMQQALEALDVVKLQYTQNRHINDAIRALEALLKEQNTLQTHITWDERGVRTVNGIPDDAPQEIKPCKATDRGECEGRVCPLKRPWQGLTPEEMKHLYPYGKSVWGKETYEAIEKALKEKNT